MIGAQLGDIGGHRGDKEEWPMLPSSGTNSGLVILFEWLVPSTRQTAQSSIFRTDIS